MLSREHEAASPLPKRDTFLNWLVVLTWMLMPFMLVVGIPLLLRLSGEKP